MSDPKEELRKLLDRGDPDPWIWDKDGDEVIGRALRLERRSGDFGLVVHLILEVDGVERSVRASNKVLLEKLEDVAPKPGEWLGIRRLGEIQPKTRNGRPYIGYLVKPLREESQALDFSSIQALPEAVDAEVVDDHPEIQHLPRVDEGGF